METKLETIDLLDAVTNAFPTCRVTYEHPGFIQVTIDEKTYVVFNDEYEETDFQFSWTIYIDDAGEYFGEINRVYETPEQIASELFQQVWDALVK